MRLGPTEIMMLLPVVCAVLVVVGIVGAIVLARRKK